MYFLRVENDRLQIFDHNWILIQRYVWSKLYLNKTILQFLSIWNPHYCSLTPQSFAVEFPGHIISQWANCSLHFTTLSCIHTPHVHVVYVVIWRNPGAESLPHSDFCLYAKYPSARSDTKCLLGNSSSNSGNYGLSECHRKRKVLSEYNKLLLTFMFTGTWTWSIVPVRRSRKQ